MIFDWVKQKLNEGESKKALADIEDFLGALKRKSDSEMAMLLAIATIIRLNFAQKGGLSKALLDDNSSSIECRKSIIYLTGVIREFKKRDHAFDAAGTMVWLYSLKSHLSPDVESKVIDLWRQLARGLPQVEEKFIELADMTGTQTPAQALTDFTYIPGRIKSALGD